MHFSSVGKLRLSGHLYLGQQLQDFASKMRNTSVGDDIPLSAAHFLSACFKTSWSLSEKTTVHQWFKH